MAGVRDAAVTGGPDRLPGRSEVDLLWDEVARLRTSAAALRKTVWERDRALAGTTRELDRANRQVAELRRSIARIKGRRAVRVAIAFMATARRVAAVVRRAGYGFRPAPAPQDPVHRPLPDEPGAHRRELRRRLGRDGALSVALVGGRDEFLRAWDPPGWRVFTERAGDDLNGHDVVVLLAPDVDGHSVDRGAVLVGLVRDRPEAWLQQPWFDDLDVVLAADERLTGVLAEGGTRVPVTLADDGLTREALAEALVHWCEATRFSVCTPTPNREVADRWGDTFFARALQGELERAGHPTRIYLRDEFGTAHLGRADVGLHLLGLAVPATRSGQVNVLWVISHPERITPELCNGYDLVLAASERFAERLRPRIDVPVLPLLQATDHRRFRPDHTGPAHDLIFVANARWTRRRIIDDLTPTDLDLAVYGREWTPDLIDPRHVRSDGVPNAELHRYYSSARIVLNDHAQEMAADGFVSNRVYDALACGAVVISDPVAGLDEQFDGAVMTYEGRTDLYATVTRLLADGQERRRRGDRGRRAVLERHTFAARVATLTTLVEPFLAASGTSRAATEPMPARLYRH